MVNNPNRQTPIQKEGTLYGRWWRILSCVALVEEIFESCELCDILCTLHVVHNLNPLGEMDTDLPPAAKILK